MWLDKLNKMKKLSGKKTEEISNISGIPLGTLNKIFAGQTKDPKLSTIKAIVTCLGYTLDDLSDSPVDDINRPITKTALDIARAFEHAEPRIQNAVCALLDLPLPNEEQERKNA